MRLKDRKVSLRDWRELDEELGRMQSCGPVALCVLCSFAGIVAERHLHLEHGDADLMF